MLTLRRAGKDGTGRLFEDVFYTPVMAESLVRGVHDLLDAGAAGVFNVVSAERISKYEFGCRLAERFGLVAVGYYLCLTAVATLCALVALHRRALRLSQRNA